MILVFLLKPLIHFFLFYLISESFWTVFTWVGSLGLVDGLDVLFQTSFFSKLFLAVGTFFRYNRAVETQMTRVTFLLKRQAADRAAGHLGSDAEVAEHVAHQGFVVLEVFITVGAHL
jgi:hypothetical protein